MDPPDPRLTAMQLVDQVAIHLDPGDRAAFDDAFADDDFDLALSVLVDVVDKADLKIEPALLAAGRAYASRFLADG